MIPGLHTGPHGRAELRGGSQTSTAATFRPDIEGLRGLAVGAVIAYHAGVPFTPGGFVGVDVFFVLSGYLITGLLIDDRRRHGRVRFAEFFARRVRRLLPTATVVFVSSIALSIVALNPLQAFDLAGQSRWVALYASNLWLARNAIDYLRPDVVSPFQHYWSLAVEEQFYVVWPALLAAATMRVRPDRLLGRLRWLVVGLSAGSFALCVYLTDARQPWAFFLLPPRAWELAAGAGLAIAARRAVAPWPCPEAVGWMGLAAVASAVVGFGADTTFPGWAVLLPVAGTAMIIGRDRATAPRSVNRFLDNPPLRWLGRYSYAAYLWHWPLLVIPAAATGHPLPAAQRAGLVALALVLSVITQRLVENPVRFSPLLVGRPRRNVGLAVALTAVSLAAGLLLSEQDPSGGRRAAGTGTDASSGVGGPRATTVPDDLVPSLADSRTDRPAVYEDGCHLDVVDSDPLPCRFGPPDATHSVVLLGDSHAAQWFPALLEAASRRHWSLRSLTKSSCPPADVVVDSEVLRRRYTECETWRRAVLDELAADPPDIVVIGAKSAYYVDRVGRDAWIAGLTRTVEALASHSTVAVLRDTPAAPSSVPDCLAVHLDDVRPCEPVDDPGRRSIAEAERSAVEQAGQRFVDTWEYVCGSPPCPVIVGRVLAYRDQHHLTTEFSRGQAGPLGDALDAMLPSR